MDFEYTEYQEAIRKMVREFAENEIAPGAAERDRTGEFDYALYKRLGDLGICGMVFPEEFGGTDSDYLSYCLALEEIGRVDLALSWTLFVGLGIAAGIAKNGTEEQKQRFRGFIDATVRGEAIGAPGITEPGGGSDTRAIETTAVLDGDEWVINGSKAFISNAGLKHCLVASVVCLTDRETRQHTSILVPKGTPGFEISAPYRKMGLKSSYTGELHFDNCRVPATNQTGERGLGRRATVGGLARARIALASTAIGLHQACYDAALNYAKDRIAFGRPIAQFQHVQQMLVEMALNLEMGRLLRDKAATMADEGKPVMKEGSMVKWFACESAIKAAKDAVQIFGAAGFLDETPVSRYYRDIRAATIADGTTEIQKWIIAREIGCYG